MIYYIFRHGETYFSKNSLPYEDQITSAGILPERIPVLERLGKYLKEVDFDIHYSSPFNRCIQTSDIVKSITKKEYIIDQKLGEYRDDIGETFNQLRSRIQSFISQMESGKSKMENIAVCTHGGCISTLKHLLLTGNAEESEIRDYPKPGVIWVIENQKLKELDFN